MCSASVQHLSMYVDFMLSRRGGNNVVRGWLLHINDTFSMGIKVPFQLPYEQKRSMVSHQES